jgi:hypothetical protein
VRFISPVLRRPSARRPDGDCGGKRRITSSIHRGAGRRRDKTWNYLGQDLRLWVQCAFAPARSSLNSEGNPSSGRGLYDFAVLVPTIQAKFRKEVTERTEHFQLPARHHLPDLVDARLYGILRRLKIQPAVTIDLNYALTSSACLRLA